MLTKCSRYRVNTRGVAEEHNVAKFPSFPQQYMHYSSVQLFLHDGPAETLRRATTNVA